MPFRIVHAADCHLDAPSRTLERDVRARIEQGARAAFCSLVTLAIERRADCLLLAGDLFDRDLLRIPTELWLPEILAEATAAGVTVVMVTGNHDPGVLGGPIDRIAWPPERFQLVRTGRPRPIEVRRPDGSVAGVVIAAGHESSRERTNLAARFAGVAVAPDVPVAGLLHAQVQGAISEHDRYAPCSPADLEHAPCHYWALGHVHLRQQVVDAPPAWYAGCLQGRHHGEQGAKGALEVVIGADGACEIDFHPLAPVRWETLELDDLGDVHDIRGLLALAAQELAAFENGPYARPGQEWMLRVRLAGPTPYFAQLRGADAADELALAIRDELGVLGVEVQDAGVVPPIELEAHVGAPHVLGTALQLIADARDDDAVLAELTPAQLAGAPAEPEERAAYVRDLLDGLDLEVAAALLAERAP